LVKQPPTFNRPKLSVESLEANPFQALVEKQKSGKTLKVVKQQNKENK
jgi:hypothetical protein